MAAAAVGAVLAAVGGYSVPAWFAYAACAASLLLAAYLLKRRNPMLLLPLALLLVLIRIELLPTLVPTDRGVGLFLANLRSGMREAGKALFRDEAGAANGMLLGDTSGLAYWERQQFQNAGLLHLFAVSGLHVSLMVELLGNVAHTRHRALALSLVSLFLLFFCAVTDFSASVLRAAFMLLGFRITRLCERQPDPPNILCFAMTMTILCDPQSVLRAGFQLSFGAALGLILFADAMRRPFRERFPRSLILDALTASAAAIIGMLPLMAYWFGAIAWVSIPLSVLLIPTMPIILTFGFFAVLLYGMAPHIATVLSYPAYGAIKLLTMVTEALHVPQLTLPKPHPIVIVLYYVGLLFSSGLCMRKEDHPPWIGFGILALSIVLWFLI